MRAVLIDPIARTVTEVEHNGDYKEIYKLIDCDCFTVVGIEKRDAIYVDDEGLLKTDPRYFFRYRGYDQPLAGKGLVLGTNAEGDSVSCAHTAEDIRNRVEFVELNLEGWDEIDGVIDHPILGPNTPMIGHRPIFSRRDSDE